MSGLRRGGIVVAHLAWYCYDYRGGRRGKWALALRAQTTFIRAGGVEGYPIVIRGSVRKTPLQSELPV